MEVDPPLAQKISAIQPNTKYEVYTDKDPVNINIIEKESHEPMFQKQPIDEVMLKIKNFEEYCRYPYLYFYGFGNGIFYNVLLNSNETLKRVVIVEPELEIFYIAFHFSDFSNLIRSTRLTLFHESSATFYRVSDLFAFEDTKIYSKLYNLNVYNPYYNRYLENMTLINKIFIRAIEHQITALGNDSTDSLIGLEHHINNIPEMVKSPSSLELVKKLQNTKTAVIVSTGPSLHKQLPLLKEYQDYLTIVCIDASFPILYEWQIKPDIVVSLERIALTAEFYRKTPVEFQKDTIFCITSIVHQELKDAIPLGQKHISMRPFGYTRYFDMDQWGYFGVGMSAANMAYEIVYHSGFEQAILIGQDLAYGEDGETHSKGYTLDKDLFKADMTDIFVDKYGGMGMIRTNNIWKLFLNFFEKDIASAQKEMTTYNCTEGGARIHGSVEISFKEAMEKLIDYSKKKQLIELLPPTEAFSEQALEHAKKKIHEIINYGGKVQKQVEETFLKVAKMTELFEKLNEENRLEEIDFDEVQQLINEIDDIKDYFLDEKFNRVFYDIIQSYIIHQELEIAKIMVSHVTEEMAKKAKLIDWIYAHKYWLFSLAGGINAIIEITKRASKEWMEFEEEEDS